MATKKKMVSRPARCDRCNARAVASATFQKGVLYFCGHHFRKYETELEEQAVEVKKVEVKKVKNS